MTRNTCKCARRLIAVGLFLSVVCAGVAFAQLKVGEEDPLVIGSLHPYLDGSGGDAFEWTVHHPGATYIRIHFSEFELAPGDWVEVSAPDGSWSNRYEGKGPHGNGKFWAFAVPGDTAKVRLEATTAGGHGFETDVFGRGTVPIYDPQPVPESVCGSNDWEDVACYATTYPTEYERARGAVRLLIGGGSLCTGFKASDSGQFMTNNHCTASQSGVQSTQILMEYQNVGCGSGGSGNTGSVMGSQLLATDYTLDYTFFTTVGDSSNIPCLGIDARLAPEGERIYIAGHPNGGVKKLSIESDFNSGGLCEVDNSPHPGRGPETDVGYYCDTIGGSSGSPVFSGLSHQVIAIHHFGGCLNSGVRMDLIYPQISGQIEVCSDAQPPECGNGIREFGEECDGDDLGGATCADLNCTGGSLICLSNCKIDESNCTGCAVCPNSTCETGEDCNTCPDDCFAGPAGGSCGNGVCEIAAGEDCISCAADCNGVQSGASFSRYCCGDGAGRNPVGCSDSRCTGSGNTCSEAPTTGGTCCGDLVCEGSEDSFNCVIDCGGPSCGDGFCDDGIGEDWCSCPNDCSPDGSETGACTDGCDNDGDGSVDCADSECDSDPACASGCAPRNASCTVDGDCCSNSCRGNGLCK